MNGQQGTRPTHCAGGRAPKRAIGVVLLAAMLAAGFDGPAAAQEYLGRRHIAVSGQGQVRSLPDIARADLGTRVTGDTAGEAMAGARRVMARVLDAVKEAGVADRDVITSRFAIHRERVPIPRGAPGEGGQEERYVVTNMVAVTIRDLDQADAVIDRAVDAGANEIHGIRFALDDETEVAAEARRRAAADARAKAEQLARLHGVSLGDPIRIAESGAGAAPQPMFARGASLEAASATVNVGELTFTTRLDVVYEICTD